jgi:choline kinase
LARGGNGFGFEDVTGLPWIEIDFADDFRRAERTVLPELIA